MKFPVLVVATLLVFGSWTVAAVESPPATMINYDDLVSSEGKNKHRGGPLLPTALLGDWLCEYAFAYVHELRYSVLLRLTPPHLACRLPAMVNKHIHPLLPCADLTQSILEKYQAGVTGLNTLASSLSSTAQSLSESLVAGYTAYEAQYCTEASFDVGKD